MNITLVSTSNGFNDFDISEYGGVKRATVSPSIKKGDMINVYFKDGSKMGAAWLGSAGVNKEDLQRSIQKAVKTTGRWIEDECYTAWERRGQQGRSLAIDPEGS